MSKNETTSTEENNVMEERLGSVIVKLHDGKEVKMRRPKGRDMIASGVTTNPAMQEAIMISNLCMMTPQEVEDLDGDDFMLLVKERERFLK